MIDEPDEAAAFGAPAQKAALFQLLGSAHTLAILRQFVAEPGPHRFTDLQSELDVSPTTLSDRLTELCAAGIVERESHDEIPPRVEYRPTEKGRALRAVMDAVADWLDEHGA